MSRLMGDNVFVMTLGVVLIPALAIIFIGLNVLIRDGANVPGELQFLEWVASIGGVGSALGGAFHAWLSKGSTKTTPPGN